MRFPVRRVWIALGIVALTATAAIAGMAGAFELGFSSNGDAQARADASRGVASSSTSAPTSSSTTTTTTTTEPPTTAPPTTQAPAPAPAATTTAPRAVAAPVAVQLAASPGDVLAAANGQRASGGLGTLQYHAGLASCAQSMANQMAASHSMTHSNLACPLGVGGGITRVGEILFTGTASFSASFVVQYWMNSPTHRAHLMDPGYRFAGVGVATASDGSMWVAMHFGG